MGNCWKLLDLWETNSPIYPAAEISAASRGFLIAFLNCTTFPWDSQGTAKLREILVLNTTAPTPWADGFHPQQAPIMRKFLCTLDLGGISGQGGAGPAKWWFLSELGSVCTYYRYSSSLPCFQLGGWSSWWFSCMLKSVAVCGQAVGFIYQLEAPAGNSCISHSAVLGRIPQIYSF